MGQGQEVHARKLFQQFTSSGGWVLLQNTHLSLAFMEEVILIVSEQQTISPDFRLWLTTEPHPKFPITLLQVRLSSSTSVSIGGIFVMEKLVDCDEIVRVIFFQVCLFTCRKYPFKDQDFERISS